jgi:hypothetical protein
MPDKRKQKGYNPKKTGEMSESQVLAVFLKAGLTVLTPFGDSQRYDLVVEEKGKFIRVQCKTAAMRKDGKSFSFPCSSSNWNTSKRSTYKGQADVFAVFLRETDQVFIFSVKNAPTKECLVRIEPGKRQQKTRWAKDHLFKPEASLKSYS